MPRISVLIPSFNHERFLGEAIASVLAQTHADLELVIVDDGSHDGSRGVIEGFGDARIVSHFQKNRGAHAALNQALALASPESELIAILNSDDAFEPRWLERAAATLAEQPQAGFCSALLHIFGEGLPEQEAWHRDWYQRALMGYRLSGDFEASLLHANFVITTSNVVFRRALAPAGGFRALRYVHDVDFLLRLAEKSSFALVDEELVRYRLHAANTIGESIRDDRKIVFEFGWILADMLDRSCGDEATAAELQAWVLRLALALPQPAVAAVAVALFAPRAALRARGLGAELPPLESVLEGRQELVEKLIHAELDPRRNALSAQELAYEELRRARELEHKAYNAALQTMDRDNRLLEEAVHFQQRENQRVLASRTYRLGQALTHTRGLWSALNLPLRMARIALDKPVAVAGHEADGSQAR
jgi:hypothetical protein